MNFKTGHFLANGTSRCKRDCIKIAAIARGVIVLSVFFASCISHKDIINFRQGDEKEPTLKNLPRQEIVNQTDIKLQPNDIVSIVIASPEPTLAAPFNLGSGQGTTGAVTGTSYLISSDGTIDLPSLGSIKAAGLTTRALKDTIVGRVSTSLVNPSVNVRLTNFKISVLGEVQSPGSFSVESERINILEALAKAGDLTPYGERKHIMIIREKDKTREVGEIDLKGTELFMSPYYYLQQNDIVYIEPNKKKIAQLQQPLTTYTQPIQIGITILALLIAIFKK